MENILLLLQVVSIGLTIYVLLEIKKIFREVRNPVIRQKNQLPGDFKDRLRGLSRPEGQSRDNRDGSRENRGDRPQGDRDRNRDGRGDRPQGDRDRNRDGRGDRPQGDRDRNRDGNRDRNRDGNRENRGDRPQGDRDRNRDNRGDRPREPRPESAPTATAEAPAVAPSEGAPVVSGRRPLTPVGSPAASSAPVVDALAPSSLAQPVVNDAPRSFGRRQLPKAKPRFDEDDSASSSEEKSETPSA